VGKSRDRCSQKHQDQKSDPDAKDITPVTPHASLRMHDWRQMAVAIIAFFRCVNATSKPYEIQDLKSALERTLSQERAPDKP
jgi:hypothetical protein